MEPRSRTDLRNRKSSLEGRPGFRSEQMKLLFSFYSPREKCFYFALTVGALVAFCLLFGALAIQLNLYSTAQRGGYLWPYLIVFYFTMLCLSWLVYTLVHCMSFRIENPRGDVRPICFRCQYSLEGLEENEGWRICPECGERSPRHVRVVPERIFLVFFVPAVRAREEL